MPTGRPRPVPHPRILPRTMAPPRGDMTHHKAEGGSRVESRVTRLEAWAESISEKFDQHALAVRDQFRELDHALESGLARIGTRLGEIDAARRPNWQVWIGTAALCVTLFGAVGGMALVPLYQGRQADSRWNDRAFAQLEQRIQTMEKRLRALERHTDASRP